MTQTEVNVGLDRQVKRAHEFSSQVYEARRRAEVARLKLVELTRPADRNSGLLAGIVLLVVCLLFFDAAVAAPALADRFIQLGLSDALSGWAAVLASLLLMLLEMVTAIAVFRAYERSLVSGRYWAVFGWSVLALFIISVPIGLGLSQLWLVTGGNFGDVGLFMKELVLVVLLSAAHVCLIWQGRNLEQAKTEAGYWVVETWTRLMLYLAEQKERKSCDALANEYRAHCRAVMIAKKAGLEADIGPFEDRVWALIRERHSDATTGRYPDRLAVP
jgi:hypothetical protein